MVKSELFNYAKVEWDSLINGTKPFVLVGNATCGRSAGSMEIIDGPLLNNYDISSALETSFFVSRYCIISARICEGNFFIQNRN